jgi:DNA-binding MarR family transcriptional regulator
MALLIQVDSAEFSWLKDSTEATAGNLSVQLTKLQTVGYINIEKSFKNNKPLTTCSLTTKGKIAMEAYLNALKSYFDSSIS